jgi:hypothetical protein
METLMQIIFAMLLLEFFEVYLQKSETLALLIEKLYGYYNQSVFLFFLIHPTFYFSLGVLLYFDAFNFYGGAILVIKTFDIFFKIEMIRQRYFHASMDKELEEMLDLKITPMMHYFSAAIHLPLLFLAISSNLG